jgi:hypothetical protein
LQIAIDLTERGGVDLPEEPELAELEMLWLVEMQSGDNQCFPRPI